MSIMAQMPPQPQRSQSTTSLSKYYNGVNGGDSVQQITDEELQDPKLDFCNAFWAQEIGAMSGHGKAAWSDQDHRRVAGILEREVGHSTSYRG